MTADARRPRRLSRAEGHARRPPARVRPLAGARGRASRTRAGRAGFGLLVTPIFEHDRGRAEARRDAPTSCARRCTTSPTRAAGSSRCAPTAPRRSCARSRSTGRRRRGRSGTSRPTSATSGRRRAATASTGRSASRCSASTTRRSTSRSSRSRDGFYRDDLGLRDVRLLINSMGDAESRARYRDVLLAYWREHADAARRRDGARRGEPVAHPRLQARRLAGHDRARAADRRLPHRRGGGRLRAVQEGLRALGIDFEIAPRLVRGLDYYTGTMFEFQSDALDAAQNAIGGGGRYDGLVEQMGGKPTPGIGFGIGIERVLLVVRRRRRVRRAGRARRRVRRRHGRRDRRRRAARRAARARACPRIARTAADR